MQPLINNIQTEEGTTSLASLPPYHRLDIRVSKTWNQEGWQIGAFLEILNVYNRKNVIKFYNPTGDDVEEAPQFPIVPYIGLTIEF